MKWSKKMKKIAIMSVILLILFINMSWSATIANNINVKIALLSVHGSGDFIWVKTTAGFEFTIIKSELSDSGYKACLATLLSAQAQGCSISLYSTVYNNTDHINEIELIPNN